MKKKRIVPDVLSDLSSYPSQAACRLAATKTRALSPVWVGFCLLCTIVARSRVVARSDASPVASLSFSRAKGAVEPPKALSCRPVTFVLVSGGKGPPVVAEWSPGDLPFSLYRLFRDQSSGRVCAAPISPL